LRKLFALVASLMLSSASPVHAGEPYAHDDTAVVRITCSSEDSRWTGTGVKVSETTYVTADHVTRGGECYADDTRLTVAYENEELDFAMFVTDADVGGFVPYSCKGYKVGETYLADGYGDSFYWARHEPWLATEYKWGLFQSFIGNGAPGMSGGPVFNRKGEVVGVVNMRWPMRSIALVNTPLCKGE
jgi:hypothetical protein